MLTEISTDYLMFYVAILHFIYFFNWIFLFKVLLNDIQQVYDYI